MNNHPNSATREKFRQACEMQAEACAALGSPFTSQLCTLMARRAFSAQKLEEELAIWPGDLSYRVHSVPLRLCGAINALARSGEAPELTALYPPHHPRHLGETFWHVLDAAVVRFENQILAQLDFAPQTNEVRRAGALMPALLGLVQQFELPIKLYEMGASAGLNLALDHFGYQLGGQYYGPADAPFTLHPDWQGPPPPHADTQITSRQGCDLNPLNVQRADDAERLMSYIWPDQIERVERKKKAIALVNDLEINLAKQDAATWLKSSLKECEKGYIHVVFNTVAFQYFPPKAQQDIRDILAKTGAVATALKPLAWLQLEVDDATPGFAITQQMWPNGQTVELARADAHGRWVNWHSTPKSV